MTSSITYSDIAQGDIIELRNGQLATVKSITVSDTALYYPVIIETNFGTTRYTLDLEHLIGEECELGIVAVVKESAALVDSIYNGTATITPEMQNSCSAFHIMANGTEVGKRSNFDATYLYIAYQMGDEFYFVAFAQNGNDLEIEEHGMMHATSVQGVMDHLQDLA